MNYRTSVAFRIELFRVQAFTVVLNPSNTSRFILWWGITVQNESNRKFGSSQETVRYFYTVVQDIYIFGLTASRS